MEADDVILYHDGEPCKHKECLNHISHPCEECGRIGGKGIVYKPPFDNFIEYFKKQTGADNVKVIKSLDEL